MKNHIFRLLGLVLFFLFCYHLDSLLKMLFEYTDFFAAPAPPVAASWWERAWESGKFFIFDKLGELIEFLLVISGRLFWPFLFAAIAVPILLPGPMRARNRWSIALIFALTVVSIFVFLSVKNDLSALWSRLQKWSLPDSPVIESLTSHLKWAMVVFAINLTIIYTFLYRVLQRLKIEQLLYFVVLMANAIYILLPDPILGEVDDVVGLFITAFLSLAIFCDRLLTTNPLDTPTQNPKTSSL